MSEGFRCQRANKMAKNTANPLNWDFGITGVERYLNAPP